MSEVTEQQLEDIEALFVQTAASMSSEGDTVTLHGLSPSTLYFSDRPQREVGHMTSRSFVDLWAGDDLTYRIKVLDGAVPASTGPCALFIDPFGRPLSPVSAAGMHRRARRRRR